MKSVAAEMRQGSGSGPLYGSVWAAMVIAEYQPLRVMRSEVYEVVGMEVADYVRNQVRIDSQS